ncbi:MAG: alpha/beta hydrolase [Erysipelotrichaceae bacterium]|nr:alpha/beta hydrolase [Erysipelotrichaceae bacterium]
MKKKILATTALIPTAGVAAAGLVFFHKVFDRIEGVWGIERTDREPGDDQYLPFRPKYEEVKRMIHTLPYEEVTITSFDGLKLYARYYPNPDARRAILCAHGYRSTAIGDFYASFEHLYKEASLLLIDERSCGKSEGSYSSFGALEKKDVQLWAEWLDKRVRHKLPLYLYGISMGASTVLLASVLKLPENVKGVLADCGYTSGNDILHDVFKDSYKVKPRLMTKVLDLYAGRLGHFHLKDCDVRRALLNAKLPVRFMHGLDDDFVFPRNTQRNYDACSVEDKDILWVEGAGHACAAVCGGERYLAYMDAFFAEREQEKG